MQQVMCKLRRQQYSAMKGYISNKILVIDKEDKINRNIRWIPLKLGSYDIHLTSLWKCIEGWCLAFTLIQREGHYNIYQTNGSIQGEAWTGQ